MQKVYVLNNPKVKLPRQFEAVKHDIRRYIKRERRKALPEGVDFWDFDCRFGKAEEGAERVHSSVLIKSIDDAESQGLTSFYVEILVKRGYRLTKPKGLEEKS